MRLSLFLFVVCGFLMSNGAARYAHLVLALGQHDPDYVDAFCGPADRKTEAAKES